MNYDLGGSVLPYEPTGDEVHAYLSDGFVLYTRRELPRALLLRLDGSVVRDRKAYRKGKRK